MSTPTATATFEAAPFDLTGPLPTATTVLEASAGTGKTYTIAALATRYLAEGVPLESIMMVTFSRAATTELRVRVRARLVETEAALRGVVAGGNDAQASSGFPVPLGDPVTALLADGDPDTILLRADRLAAALTEFDEATIATTHEFCARMLSGLGILSHADPGRVFTESLTTLADEVSTDTYLRRHAGERRPTLALDDATNLARQVAHQPQCALVPAPGADPDPGVEARARFAAEVRAELRSRQLRQRLFTHDDILFALRDSLADPTTGPDAVRMLHEQYRVVLVDEFQDTDPVQWDIVRLAFDGTATVILIGDPKQAIYAFRGADVHTYLDAVGRATRRATLNTNYRSDAPMVAAVEHLFAEAALGDPRIGMVPLTAHHGSSRLRGPDGTAPAPLRLRMLPSKSDGDHLPSVHTLRPRIRRDLVSQVVELLDSGTELAEARPDGAPSWRRVEPSDIAVLVQKNERAKEICDALVAAGVPAVLAGASTVFGSEMARHWLTLLRALVEPRSATIRRAALTPMIGWDFARLVSATEEDLAELSLTIRTWAATAQHRGIAALLELVVDQQGLAARLLAHDGGEREVTDLRHLGQLLHTHMTTERVGLAGVAEWLATSIDQSQRSTEDEQSRRLETDAKAVQVLTVHRAKGLEFGIVLLPEPWDVWAPDDKGQVLRLHEPDTGRLILDIGGTAAQGRNERRQQWRDEEAGEDLRLLYVALTRARHQVITWWAASWNTKSSPLHRLLYGPRTPGAIPPPSVPIPADPGALSLDSGLIRVETVPESIPVRRWRPPGAPAETLAHRSLTRELDQLWRRTSYTALTAAAHAAPAADVALPSGDDEVGTSDEPATDIEPAVTGAGPLWLSPMGDLPAGAEFGTIMHAIFEHADATAPDLAAELLARTREELERTPYPVQPEALALALVPAFQTPLGPLGLGRRLCDLAPTDRLSELDFELPLAGGDRPTAHITLADVAAVLARHLPPDDPLADYPAQLATEPTGEEVLRGFLTGSIDSVLRIPDTQGNPRHLVVDYKSNWLGEFGVPLPIDGYHPERLATAMMRAHYPLQALLYSVALHRYLHWRLPGYDPAQHLGGIAYLFVRGMAGADTPTADGVPYGVFSWDPGPGLVVELSELLAGHRHDGADR